MILDITAFEERPGIAVVLPTEFNFLSFFGFAPLATYAHALLPVSLVW